MDTKAKQGKKTPIQVYLNERELSFIDKLQSRLLDEGIEKSYSSIIRESFIMNLLKEAKANE